MEEQQRIQGGNANPYPTDQAGADTARWDLICGSLSRQNWTPGVARILVVAEIARVTQRIASLSPTAEGRCIMQGLGEQLKALREFLKVLSLWP
jgi:hypothetical protein